MQVNLIEILNVVLALFLLVAAISRNSGGLLTAFFAYGSLYFLYSAIPLIMGTPLDEISAMHVVGVGGGVLVKLSTIIFLLVMFVALGIRAIRFIEIDKRLQLYFGVVMAIVFMGYLNNLRIGDWLQLQNVVGVEGMLALVLLGYMGLRGDMHGWNIKRAHLYVINGVLVIAVSIAFYEVFSQRAWAGTVPSSGIVVHRASRASSIFFNPNLYAFWSSLIFLGCAYGMHEYAKYRKSMFFGMSMASIGIYFSGARSASFLLLGVLFFCAVLIKGGSKRLRWIPLITMPLIFLMIYSVARGILACSLSNYEGWHSVAVLGERFAATPINMLQYILSKLPSIPAYQWIKDAFPVPPEVGTVLSIEGRFNVGKSDSSFVALFTDTGLFGLTAMLWLWGTLFVWGMRTYMKKPDASNVYSCAILLYCFLVGLAMRFQVFPVWLLIGVSLAPCLVIWRKSAQ
jgi:hypothetical protein